MRQILICRSKHKKMSPILMMNDGKDLKVIHIDIFFMRYTHKQTKHTFDYMNLCELRENLTFCRHFIGNLNYFGWRHLLYNFLKRF